MLTVWARRFVIGDSGAAGLIAGSCVRAAAPALTNEGADALRRIVAGMHRWFRLSSRGFRVSAHGGRGSVVEPLCGTTPFVGFFFAPHGKAVYVGKPLICISNDGCASLLGSTRRKARFR